MASVNLEPCSSCHGQGWINDSQSVPRRCMMCDGDGVREVHYLDEAEYRAEKRKLLAQLRKFHERGLWHIANLPPADVDELPDDYQLAIRPGPATEVVLRDIQKRRGVSRDDALLILGEEVRSRLRSTDPLV